MVIKRLTPTVIAAIVAALVWTGGSNVILAVGEEGKNSPNPLSGDKDAEKAGKTKYRANCAFCHGMRANGRGRGLPNAADLRKYKRGYTRFVKAVKEGYKTMPEWGGMGEITDEQINQIGAYLETLAKRNANWADPPDTSVNEPEATVVPASSTTSEPAEPMEYQIHIGHILTSWQDTPGGVGLAQILEEEAMIAKQHAGYAVTDLEDLPNIQLHTRHVRHAVDPTAERSGEGPGRGYGIVKAAAGIVQHMELSRDAADASESAKIHSEHVLASARNIQFWAGKILAKAGQVVGGASPVSSAFYAEEIVEHVDWILNGRDADGDGNVSWTDGEGGLAQVKAHLSFIE